MPAFHRRDLAVRSEPAGLDPLRAYCSLAQALFDPALLREWERALERAFARGSAGAPFVQMIEVGNELCRRAQLRRDDAQRALDRALDHVIHATAARARRRVVTRRRRVQRRAQRRAQRGARLHARTERVHGDLRALLCVLRELPFRLLEASLIWPFTDEERARWLAFFHRLTGRPARREPPPQPRFDVYVRPDPIPRAVRVAAARRLRAALLEALRSLALVQRRITANATGHG